MGVGWIMRRFAGSGLMDWGQAQKATGPCCWRRLGAACGGDRRRCRLLSLRAATGVDRRGNREKRMHRSAMQSRQLRDSAHGRRRWRSSRAEARHGYRSLLRPRAGHSSASVLRFGIQTSVCLVRGYFVSPPLPERGATLMNVLLGMAVGQWRMGRFPISHSRFQRLH
jgi:hypothetical protein